MKRKAQPINFDCDERVQDALTSRDFGVHVVKNEHDGEESVDLFIYGVVGGDMFDEDPLTAASVATFLAENRGLPVNARINSPGGLAFDGITIYNALVAHDAPVTTTIEGIAASAASIIAMAGDTIRMHENATLMIHRAFGLIMGNAADMADYSERLASLDSQLAGTYAARTGQRRDTIANWMVGKVDGTRFDAKEAKANRFVDEIVPNKKKVKASAEAIGDAILSAGAAFQSANEARSGGPDDIAAREQLATREREGRARKLRLMEIDGHASQTPTG